MNIVDFIEARIDEDEAAAKAATVGGGSTWSAVGEPGESGELVDAEHGGFVAWNGEARAFPNYEDAVHIARHDPARVLRECEAKREIVRLYRDAWVQSTTGRGSRDKAVAVFACQTALYAVAGAYSDHPDYRQEWAL